MTWSWDRFDFPENPCYSKIVRIEKLQPGDLFFTIGLKNGDRMVMCCWNVPCVDEVRGLKLKWHCVGYIDGTRMNELQWSPNENVQVYTR